MSRVLGPEDVCFRLLKLLSAVSGWRRPVAHFVAYLFIVAGRCFSWRMGSAHDHAPVFAGEPIKVAKQQLQRKIERIEGESMAVTILKSCY